MNLPDEAAIHACLLDTTTDDATPLLQPDELAGVLVEGEWLVVALPGAASGMASSGSSLLTGHSPGTMQAEADLLRRVYTRLAATFPGARVEVRTPGRVFRGGAGFGEGRHVIAVVGGKGGVGKSTVAVNLALTLSALGVSTGLIDADLNAPDIPHMLGLGPGARPGRERTRTAAAARPSEWRRPLVRYGMEVVSVGFEVPERFPPVISTRMLVASLLRGFIFEVGWSAGVLVIDAPPGTGEELRVLAGSLPLSGVVFVTTPQDLAQMDAARTLTLLEQNGVPVIGMVQNMASLTCPHCAQAIDMYALSSRLSDAGVPVLGSIPFDTQLSVTADQGCPLVLGEPRGPIAFEFARIATGVRRWLAARTVA